MKFQWLSPAEYPTWHEISFKPATPEHMHLVLTDEGKGCQGEFGHHYWGEHHPSFTTHLIGFVWLPDINQDEVPRSMYDNTVVGEYGRIYLRAIIDESVVPAWT
jgi:hypothetical protein